MLRSVYVDARQVWTVCLPGSRSARWTVTDIVLVRKQAARLVESVAVQEAILGVSLVDDLRAKIGVLLLMLVDDQQWATMGTTILFITLDTK